MCYHKVTTDFTHKNLFYENARLSKFLQDSETSIIPTTVDGWHPLFARQSYR